MEKLHLSNEHADWLEDKRQIHCELAAKLGVVTTRDGNLAFEYRRNGETLFLKVRKEVVRDGQPGKSYWIEPKGSDLFLWNADSLSEPSGAPLIVTEGEFDALSFAMAGAPHVVSVPNGAAGKPGEGDIVPDEDRQAVLSAARGCGLLLPAGLLSPCRR